MSCTYGIPAEKLAALCRVSIATARRWKAGTTRIPHTAAAIITGDLGAFSAFWRGWQVQGENLISPDGWTIGRNDALIVPLMHGQISALRQELQKYKDKEFAGLEEQPTEPADISKISA